MEQPTHNGHVLWEIEDFANWTEAQRAAAFGVAENVCLRGMSICKVCGAAEIELSIPCGDQESEYAEHGVDFG